MSQTTRESRDLRNQIGKLRLQDDCSSPLSHLGLGKSQKKETESCEVEKDFWAARGGVTTPQRTTMAGMAGMAGTAMGRSSPVASWLPHRIASIACTRSLTLTRPFADPRTKL